MPWVTTASCARCFRREVAHQRVLPSRRLRAGPTTCSRHHRHRNKIFLTARSGPDRLKTLAYGLLDNQGRATTQARSRPCSSPTWALCPTPPYGMKGSPTGCPQARSPKFSAIMVARQNAPQPMPAPAAPQPVYASHAPLRPSRRAPLRRLPAKNARRCISDGRLWRCCSAACPWGFWPSFSPRRLGRHGAREHCQRARRAYRARTVVHNPHHVGRSCAQYLLRSIQRSGRNLTMTGTQPHTPTGRGNPYGCRRLCSVYISES